MDVRPYELADRASCLAVFDSNIPHYFRQEERPGFEAFLDDPNCPYLVMEHEGTVAGCGGFVILAEQGVARLVWGMVRLDSQKLGLGRFLLLFRLREIGRINSVSQVYLETSQHTAGFFAKQGFKLIDSVPDGLAPGLDRVEMVKRLAVCAS